MDDRRQPSITGLFEGRDDPGPEAAGAPQPPAPPPAPARKPTVGPLAGRTDFAATTGRARDLAGPRRRPDLSRALETGRTRLVVAGAAFAVAFLALSGRLVDLALLQGAQEPKLVRTAPSTRLETGRADIVDRNGNLLATSLRTASLYADPRRVRDPRRAARRLVKVLPRMSPAELEAKLSAEKSFVWIKRNLTPREKAEVNRLGIPGLDFLAEERRIYPYSHLTAHILGFTNVDGRGLSGIEQSFDDVLRARREPLALSIDVRVQHIVHEELSAAASEFRAIGGGAVVLDARTGEVVAMVSLPSFDPHDPGGVSPDSRFNRITLGVYEMGSTFKLLTAAMALDSGIVDLNGGFDASRPLRVSRYTITDYHAQNRWLSVPEIIVHSSNIGSALMARAVGPAAHKAFLQKLGMLRALPLELPELGQPMSPRPWREINTLTIAYGHGLAVSPLHLATGIAALVNGGVLRPPTLLHRGVDDDPEAVARLVGERVIKPETSDAMRHLMRLVVERGTGRKAKAPGYVVGGKTGTAEKNFGGRYSERALLSSFVGAFPMDDPRYVVIAMLDEPKGNESTHGYSTGGWVAAPVVGRVVTRMAPLVGIEPRDPGLSILPTRRQVRADLGSGASGAGRETF